MPRLTSEERLLLNGFVNMEGILPEKEIDELRLKSEAALFRTSKEHRQRHLSTGSLCNFADHPEFASIISDPRIIRALEEVGGKDVRWTSGYLISKPAGGPPLFWHQDWWGWQNPYSYQPKAAQLFVMVYLTKTTVENGCLRVIPGSHLTPHELHDVPEAHTVTIGTKIAEDSQVYSSHPDEVAVPVNIGDVIIGDSRLLHSAYANKSNEERPLLTIWYTPSYRDLPPSIQSTIRIRYEDDVAERYPDIPKFPTIESWPAYALDKVRHLLPEKVSTSEPEPWDRIPDQSKMSLGERLDKLKEVSEL